MRASLLVLTGVCLLTPGVVHAQGTGRPQTPPPAAGKPATPAQDRKEVKLPEKVLQTYVGEYELREDWILTVTLENGSLWGQPSNQAKRQMFAESETKFYLKDLPVNLTFHVEKGKVTGLTMEQEGRGTRELKKIK